MIYLQLFYEFFKTGLFAVGGGLATLPFLYDISDRFGWFTESQLADMIAISESTPGAIGINMSTYAGFLTTNVTGAVVATLGLITPSVVIVILISRVLSRFQNDQRVQAVFYGLRPASTALIASAGLSVMSMDLLQLDQEQLIERVDWMSLALAVGLFILMKYRLTKHLHPIVFILIAAGIGILFGMGS
ncbi:chromate transporter [Pelagirhabdus alkalitolerans]|uniref:Chromate transporter n=1 Tax=Pelagirhabdus alkalitolerans TaxID=1612202 RepID=A0A1G6H8M0_9BACI|nr:chromate transporter [Pelagirhabdus alkalitolerans]SDB90295.1 chromate transporter [Pelagirhabdus alkalitolerans]